MAVHHMVWIKFGPEIDAERVRGHLEGLQALKRTVPGVRELTIGANFTERALGCTHGLSVILDDRAALAAYAVHPEHVAVATRLRADAQQVLALDYEF